MSLYVHSGTAPQAQLANPLKRSTLAALAEIQQQIEAIDPSDVLVHQISAWRTRFLQKLRTNDDLQPIIHTFVEEMLSFLNSSSLLALPIRKIDARHHLLAALITFTKQHRALPDPLKQALERIHALPLKDKEVVRIQQIRARKAAEAEARRPAAPLANVYTIKELELRAQKEEQLRADLMQLKELIQIWEERDEMTIAIQIWADQFLNSLNLTAPFEQIQAAYIQLLQQLLKEPINDTPLDEKALYGSDGHTYGKKAHKLWQEGVPFRYRNRSPFNPEDPAKLILKPHPVVRYMTGWLKKHGALLVSEDIAKAYEEIPLRNQAAVRAGKLALQQHAASLNQADPQEWQKKSAAQAERLQKRGKGYVALMADQNKIIEQQFQQSEQNIKHVMDQNGQAIRQLYQELPELNQSVANLEELLNRQDQEVNEIEQATNQLQVEIDETRKAIKKSKKKGKLGVLKVAASIAVSALASYGLYEVVQATTLVDGAAVVPINNGLSAKVVVLF